MQENNLTKPKVIAIVGPTASGKTSFAIDLALKLNTEIISADSRLVYKFMDIGTAKPSSKELSQIQQHMINVIEPSVNEFSLGEYLKQAYPLLINILEKKKIVIVVGGTGFYLRALLEGSPLKAVAPCETFRETLKDISTEELFQRLINKRNIHENDRFRIIRALEVQEFSNSEETILENNFDIEFIGLNFDRAILRQRIRERSENMLKQGLIDECKFLLSKYGELEIFHKTIGYKECIEALKTNDFDNLLEKIVISTAQYAKRQMTWFKTNKKINWINN